MITFAFALVASFSLIGVGSVAYCLKRAPIGNEDELGFQAAPERPARGMEVSLPDSIVGISR